MQGFNTLSEQVELGVAFVFVGTVTGIVLYGTIIAGTTINADSLLIWHSHLAALVALVETLIAMKSCFSTNQRNKKK